MYWIIGADQQQYGPVSAEQLRQWITEGRANGQTQVRPDPAGEWRPLASFPEFASALPAVPVEVVVEPPSARPLVPPPGSSATPPQTHPLAVTGIVMGALGLACCPVIFSTVGLVVSIIALNQIQRQPEQYTGKGLATAGIILSLVGFLMSALLFFTGTTQRILRDLLR